MVCMRVTSATQTMRDRVSLTACIDALTGARARGQHHTALPWAQRAAVAHTPIAFLAGLKGRCPANQRERIEARRHRARSRRLLPVRTRTVAWHAACRSPGTPNSVGVRGGSHAQRQRPQTGMHRDGCARVRAMVAEPTCGHSPPPLHAPCSSLFAQHCHSWRCARTRPDSGELDGGGADETAPRIGSDAGAAVAAVADSDRCRSLQQLPLRRGGLRSAVQCGRRERMAAPSLLPAALPRCAAAPVSAAACPTSTRARPICLVQTLERKRVRACVPACVRACVRQPPLPSGVTAEDWARNDNIFEAFFDAGAGYLASEDPAHPVGGRGGSASTYGEVTVLGGRQLAEAMFSGHCRNGADKSVVFYDLGSGTGRLTAQMFLDQPAVSRAVGVELSAARHSAAASAASRLASSLPEAAGGIRFVHGNALTADTSDATHIFVASLCFPADVTAGIAGRIVRSCSSGEARHLRVVAALSVLEDVERAQWPRRVEQIQTSWGSARVFLYSRPGVCP